MSTSSSGLRRSHHRVCPFEQLAGPQPVPDRHRETELGPVQHVRGHDRLQRPAQRVLGGGPGDLLVERQPGRHGEHLGIQERHPQLQRVGHRHLVGLDQDVAAQPGEQVDVLHAGDRIPAGRLGIDRRRHVGMRPVRRGSRAAPPATARRRSCGHCRSSAARASANRGAAGSCPASPPAAAATPCPGTAAAAGAGSRKPSATTVPGRWCNRRTARRRPRRIAPP